MEKLNKDQKEIIKVRIDPGHAPSNPNRGPSGYIEYEGVWIISTYLKEILETKGLQVDFTRTWDQDPELMARGKMAQGYDLFISQHTNAYDKNTRGVEVFYDINKPQDRLWADKLAGAVSTIMDNPNRGAKTRVYTVGNTIYNYYGVIRGASTTDCRHIFLIESGFHDNLQDEAFLKVDENLKKIALAQAKVIFEILGVEDMTVEEAEKIVQEKAGLDNNTMQYLRFYRYGDPLLIKLANAMRE